MKEDGRGLQAQRDLSSTPIQRYDKRRDMKSMVYQIRFLRKAGETFIIGGAERHPKGRANKT